MTAAERELLRHQLLLSLAAQASFALTPRVLAVQTSLAGLVVTDVQIAQELQYLADKNFVQADAKAVSPELKRYRLTAAGRDYLAEQGLA